MQNRQQQFASRTNWDFYWRY